LVSPIFFIYLCKRFDIPKISKIFVKDLSLWLVKIVIWGADKINHERNQFVIAVEKPQIVVISYESILNWYLLEFLQLSH